jgi:dipeptidyl aminopeptidase/acylaminoacyl peptidase
MRPALMNRRDVLRGAAGFGATLPLVGLARTATAQSELIARRVLFDNPDYRSVRISPDGKHLAWLAPLDGVSNLWIAPVAEPQAGRPLTRATDRHLSNYIRWAHTSRHIVFFQERDGDENWRASSVDIETGATVLLTPERGVRALLQELDRKFPDEMLFRYNARDKRFFDLFRINIVTGASTLVYENHDYGWLFTDSAFRLRLAGRTAADGTTEIFERRPDGAWVPFATVPIGDSDATRLIDLSDDGSTLYLLDSRGRDKAALVALDMATRASMVLAADDEADMTTVAVDADRRPFAAAANKHRVRWQALVPEAARDLAQLAANGPGDVELISISDDNRLMTVYYERDAASGEYALLDRRTGEVRSLFQQRKAFAGLALRPMTPVVIAARDGLKLNGYLTVPATGGGTRPMVLLVHGGPYWRDYWGLQSGAPVAGRSRLCGTRCQLPGLDRLRQGFCHGRRPRMGRAHA